MIIIMIIIIIITNVDNMVRRKPPVPLGTLFKDKCLGKLWESWIITFLNCLNGSRRFA